MSPAETVLTQGAGLKKPEDLTLLHEVADATAGVSHLEMCIQCGTCGGSCPYPPQMDKSRRRCRIGCTFPNATRPL